MGQRIFGNSPCPLITVWQAVAGGVQNSCTVNFLHADLRTNEGWYSEWRFLEIPLSYSQNDIGEASNQHAATGRVCWQLEARNRSTAVPLTSANSHR